MTDEQASSATPPQGGSSAPSTTPAQELTLQPKPCPSCGHCPTCGRGGFHFYPPYMVPVYPYQPVWWVSVTTGTMPDINSGSYQVFNLGAAQ